MKSIKKFTIFAGVNGAGKSTTFRMLCGLLPLNGGSLEVAGVDLHTASAKARRKLGYVAQKFSLYRDLSTRENLNFFAGAYGLRGAHRKQRIEWAIQNFQLEKYIDLPAGRTRGRGAISGRESERWRIPVSRSSLRLTSLTKRNSAIPWSS